MASVSPDLSVIVPVYNDPSGIATTIASLRSQSLPEDEYELLIVDNGSSDRTRAVITDRLDGADNARALVEAQRQGSYAARNTGIRASDGDILAFVDADMTVPEEWLEHALEAFDTAATDYMGCNVELTLPDSPTLASRYDHHTGFPVPQYLEHQQFVPTCCLFVRREVFADVGLFDHRLVSGGDKEFGNRVHDAGYDTAFAEGVSMVHPTRNSLCELVRKDLRVGRGLCQLQRYHPDRYGTPGVPPRPSGVKAPDRNLPRTDRIAFSALSTLLTAVRGIGYYREYLADDRESSRERGLPTFEE
ncbi:glycosyltransferase family 2 protein [Natrinema pallidum]|uniref:Glycosyltransferase n=1 Tax=Natrinema pallidum TaxID=69527 RepID=A0A4P9TDU6_9EURY|nr:glycosyltransferase [Natrinema pallidum]QCW02749.1 glycosyltransferase [Natrinema pallidum]